MPLYEVTHSHPLTDAQKQSLASKITYLHSRTFTTPSLFVNVAFFPVDATVKNYYLGGKPQTTCANRIKAYVRTSDKRTKEHFDKLAEQIEEAWLAVVAGVGEDEKVTGDAAAAKKLVRVGFVPGITARELSFALPLAGDEGAWVKQYREEFERRAELGEEGFTDMLEEIEQREDLAAWKSQ